MFEEFKKEFKYQLQEKKLSELCTLKIGGYTDLFFEVKTEEELIYAIKTADKYNIPYFLVGCGSNIFFNDEGFEGLIIKNSLPKTIKINKDYLTVTSSVEVKLFSEFCIENSVAGFEFMSGIPGTMGGAVYMNAGAFGKNIGEKLHSAKIIDKNAQVKTVYNDYFKFDYRKSILKETGEVVLNSKFSYEKGDREEIKKRVKEILDMRKKRHPEEGTLTAGSFFKNVFFESNQRRTAAGYLLDKSGSKGLTIGDAAVSEKHANFIINKGHATSKDILKLAEIMKKKVKNKFNINLEEEVIYLPKKVNNNKER